MSNNECELWKMICENENPENAVLVAIKVFSAFLEQLEATPKPPAGGLQESA